MTRIRNPETLKIFTEILKLFFAKPFHHHVVHIYTQLYMNVNCCLVGHTYKINIFDIRIQFE